MKKQKIYRYINYEAKLENIKSDWALLTNVFAKDEEEYTSWEILQKEKVILRFKSLFQRLLTELNNRPHDPNASSLINELTTYINRLTQEREILRFCSSHDVLSDSKEVSFVCNGAEWYENPMICIFAYMGRHGYPPHGNCPEYITALCKSIRQMPIENIEEWKYMIKKYDWGTMEEFDNGIVKTKYQNAMIGIFDQIRILLTNPTHDRKARVIYKLHRQYQFSPTYLARTLLPIFNIDVPVIEIMDLSAFQDLKVNGDPKWLKSLAII